MLTTHRASKNPQRTHGCGTPGKTRLANQLRGAPKSSRELLDVCRHPGTPLRFSQLVPQEVSPRPSRLLRVWEEGCSLQCMPDLERREE